jgi:mycofactocin system glycosyltransferase
MMLLSTSLSASPSGDTSLNGYRFAVQRYSLDNSWRRPKKGNVLIAGSPLRIFRLSAAGQSIAESLEQTGEAPISAQLLVTRLIDAGALHPLPSLESNAPTLSDISIVIPLFARSKNDIVRVQNLITEFSAFPQVVVVDDASPIAFPEMPNTNVTVHRQEVNNGPGVARNAGLAYVSTSHVVFIDADVQCTHEDVCELAKWWSLSQLAVLAPRVKSLNWFQNGAVVAAYEEVRSPLDMGALPARVRAGTRVSYVPSALLLCDVAALRAVNGFNESMRTGEDVDLIWRLDAAGYSCRYEPSIEVHHLPRTTTQQLVQQRMGYGESAALLATKHRGALAPLRVSGWSTGVWASIALGFPIIGGVVAAGTAVALHRKLRFLPDAEKESARLATLGHLHAGKQIANAVTRVWWPIALLLALVSRRARWALCLAAFVPALSDWWTTRPHLDPVRYTLLRWVDDMSYGFGVWKGVVREGNYDPLIPELSSWPSNIQQKSATEV